MLPLVGLVAIGLLLVVGKSFFFSDFQPDSESIPVAVVKANTEHDSEEAGNQPQNDELPETDRMHVSTGNNQSNTEDISIDVIVVNETPGNLNQDVEPQEIIIDLTVVPMAPPQQALSTPESQSEPDPEQVQPEPVVSNAEPQPKPGQEQVQPEPVASDAEPEPKPDPEPIQPESVASSSEPEAKPDPEPVQSEPAASNPKQPEQVQPTQAPQRRNVTQPSRGTWRVQIGAYSTRAAAESVVRRVTQDGHSASIVSGKTLFKVQVQAGSTRQEAQSLASRFGQSGFSGAFIVPPGS